MQVGEEDGANRIRLAGEPGGGVGADPHPVDVRGRGDEPAQRGVLRVGGERPLDAGVDQEETLGRVADGVEVDLDGLGSVLERGGARIVEVDDAAAIDLPIGAGHRLHGERTGLVDQRFHAAGRAGRAEVRVLDRVPRGRPADEDEDAEERDQRCDGGEDQAGASHSVTHALDMRHATADG